MIAENEANALPHDTAAILPPLPAGDPLPEANDTSANESPKTPVVVPEAYESDGGSEVTNDTEEQISTGSGSDEEEEKGARKSPPKTNGTEVSTAPESPDPESVSAPSSEEQPMAASAPSQLPAAEESENSTKPGSIQEEECEQEDVIIPEEQQTEIKEDSQEEILPEEPEKDALISEGNAEEESELPPPDLSQNESPSEDCSAPPEVSPPKEAECDGVGEAVTADPTEIVQQYASMFENLKDGLYSKLQIGESKAATEVAGEETDKQQIFASSEGQAYLRATLDDFFSQVKGNLDKLSAIAGGTSQSDAQQVSTAFQEINNASKTLNTLMSSAAVAAASVGTAQPSEEKLKGKEKSHPEGSENSKPTFPSETSAGNSGSKQERKERSSDPEKHRLQPSQESG